MSRTLVVLWMLATALAMVSSTAAAKPPAADEAELARVAEILEVERTSTAEKLDRRALLSSLLVRAPELPAARWQAGYVPVGDDWRAVDDLKQPVSRPEIWEEYETQRAKTAETVQGQLELAGWCVRHKLPEQERTHLTVALAHSGNADLSKVGARLGYRCIGGQWVTRREQEQLQRRIRETQQAVKRWEPRLQVLSARLAGSPAQRQNALDELEEIDDLSVVPAALALAERSEEYAEMAVRLLGNIETWESSMALACLATYTPAPDIQWRATDVLKSRRLEDFVPPLLMLMQRPAEWRYAVLIGGRGELYYMHLTVRETATHWEVAQRRLLDARVITSRRTRGPNARAGVTALQKANGALAEISNDIEQRNWLLEAHNDAVERSNSQVGEILAGVTGREVSAEADVWWKWWVDYLDVEPVGNKSVVIVEEDDEYRPPEQVVRVSSCLAAGTPIWTESGPVPVERVRVGDRVLSKDVESGELAWQPVVMTTVRQAPRNVRIRVGGETIQLTGGHPVWVSGDGWTKARDLQPGTPLHTATGMVRVESTEIVGAAAAYNLVVADFHTYFFGNQQLFSHDTTTPRLTNVVVPGLAAAE